MSSYLSPQFKPFDLYIFTCILHYLRVYYDLTTWPVPGWLDSSDCEAQQGNCRGHGFKSRSRLIFFKFYFHSCLSCVYHCDNHWCLHIFFLSSKIWSFIFSVRCFTIYLNIYSNSQHDQLSVGLIAQLVKHCTGSQRSWIRFLLFPVVLYHLLCVLAFQLQFKQLLTRSPKFKHYSGKVIVSQTFIESFV